MCFIIKSTPNKRNEQKNNPTNFIEWTMEFKIEIKRSTHTHTHTGWEKLPKKWRIRSTEKQSLIIPLFPIDKNTNWSRAASIGCQSRWIYIALMNYENSKSTSILIRLFNKSIGFQTRRRKCGIRFFFLVENEKDICYTYIWNKRTKMLIDDSFKAKPMKMITDRLFPLKW